MSFGAVVTTIPAAFFGMNLASGMEAVPGMLWPVAQTSMLAGCTTAAVIYGYYKASVGGWVGGCGWVGVGGVGGGARSAQACRPPRSPD